MSALILLAEDEPPQAEMLRYNLEKEGYRIIIAGDGDTALLLLEEETPDLVILDWMLPEVSGVEICRRIRARKETRKTPVIMLTARGEERDRVLGLESGADDYVVKPYSPGEMVARVRAVLRRATPGLGKDELIYGGVSMNLSTHKVSRNGNPVQLGPTEFKLLRIFMERPEHVFSRENLLDKVWGREIYVESRTVDVHIRRLRKTLNAGGEEDIIRTVRGAGYAIDASEPS